MLLRFTRKIEMPFLAGVLEDRLVTIDTLRSFVSNSLFLLLAYKYSWGILKEPYLYDMALEYKCFYDPQGAYESTNCNELLVPL